MKSSEIRKKFIEFFVKNDHVFYNPSYLINGENSTLFTIAGMQQFTSYFLGKSTEDKKRITIQPCLRMGGKDCDLGNVGKTKRHHTFFEMLGSFSFGGYGKKEAINLAFNFLTQVLGINEENLYITVHNLDVETYNFWLDRVSKNKILKLKENFWSAGEYGPCGPCTEIYYGPKNKDLQYLENSIQRDDEVFLEVWNSVFMEKNNSKEGLKPLETLCIDTGVGLERLSSILQGTVDNFETDLFLPLLQKIKKTQKDEWKARVVADHIRSICFLIQEDLLPGREKQSYALRRLIRRSFLYYEKLEDLVPICIKTIEYYPLDEEKIKKVISQEIKSFENTIKLAKQQIKKMEVIDEKKVFKLYDTYGLPMDLTFDILDSMNIQVNKNKVLELKKEHILKSKKHSIIDFNQRTQKLCYTQEYNKSKVLFLEKKEDKNILVTEASCFFPRGGGQIGDVGEFRTKNAYGKIIDTLEQKNIEGEVVLHIYENIKGVVQVGDQIELYVSNEKRLANTRAHSATHILCDYLTKHFNCKQKGSKVKSDWLSLDINYEKSLKDEINNLNNYMRQIIQQSIDVNIKFEDKKSLDISLFTDGKNYPDRVRIIDIPNISYQPCCGTHVKNTSEIIDFSIQKEYSIGNGLRRIEAITGIHKIEEKKVNLEKKVIQTLEEKPLIERPLKNYKYFQCEQSNSASVQKKLHPKTIIVFNEEDKTKIFAFNVEKIKSLGNFLDCKGGGNNILRFGFKCKENFDHIYNILNQILSS